jgi:hypothetical protein
MGLVRVRGEVQIGEQHLALAQLRPLARLRLLHLHHHFGLGENTLRAVGEDGPGGGIIGIREPGANPGARLDHHLMAMGARLARGGRGHADPVFLVLYFPGASDQHDSSLHHSNNDTSWWRFLADPANAAPHWEL